MHCGRLICIPLLLALLSGGCSRDRAMISTAQTLVMESSLISAGITTRQPVIAESHGQRRASSRLCNEQDQVVTLHYRFFWYDHRGLEIRPFAAVRTITVPARSEVEISSLTGNLTASRVRLYLYL